MSRIGSGWTSATAVVLLGALGCAAGTASDAPTPETGTAGGGAGAASEAPLRGAAGVAPGAVADSGGSAPENPRLCVFDYDLTLSSHRCEARAVLVPRHGATGADGGCGITQAQIDAGWSP